MNQLIKRIKSFLWRALMVGAVASIDWVLANSGILDCPLWLTGMLGLALGEVSKYLNNKAIKK